jgi:hypothetical protein
LVTDGAVSDIRLLRFEGDVAAAAGGAIKQRPRSKLPPHRSDVRRFIMYPPVIDAPEESKCYKYYDYDNNPPHFRTVRKM